MPQLNYDYVIVGAGSSGCVLAHRLSEDPNVSVCIIEAGGSHKNPVVTIPMALFIAVRSKIKNWAYKTVPQKGFKGRKGHQARGKTLGGSSAINAMIYTRGHKSDYDGWAALGNDGWAYEDILPYFKKSEHHERGVNEFHGQGGLLNIAPITSPAEINNLFIRAAQELHHPLNDDFNGAELEGVGMFEVTQKNGQRWTTADAFLDSAKHRDNLTIITIITKAMTEKIIVENGKAVGVQTKIGGKTQIIMAKNEVILSAGVFGTPQLMLLSGIGSKQKLEPHGIEQVYELKGVGENLQDHVDWIASFKSKSLDTIGFSAMGSVKITGEMFKYFSKRQGMLTSNIAESGGFLYVDRNEPAPDIQLHFTRAIVDEHGKKLWWGHGYSCHVCVLRPKSIGSVWLNSADPATSPAIDPAFLTDERDMEKLVKGAKILQGI